MSCKCKCKFDGRTCNSNQKWYNDQCWCQHKNKNIVCAKKDYFGVQVHVIAKIVNI